MGSLQKELAQTEEAIAKGEALETHLKERMADPTLYEKGNEEVQKVTRRASEVEEKLAKLYEVWERLAARIEEIEAQFAEPEGDSS